MEYTYDAWGKILSCTGDMATTLGQINPLRYRGYVYDNETQLYYLQSRYYDPEIGRFINADTFTSTGQGILGNNMYAYCGNNPVSREDDGGARHCESTTAAGVGTPPRSLPPKGEPNSSQVLHNPDGSVKQKRWYGPDGKPERDRDNNHPGDGPFPHDHEWKDGKREKDHLPPSSEYEFSWDPIVGIGFVTICSIGMTVVMLDDATGIGVADDFLLGTFSAGIGKGIALIFS